MTSLRLISTCALCAGLLLSGNLLPQSPSRAADQVPVASLVEALSSSDEAAKVQAIDQLAAQGAGAAAAVEPLAALLKDPSSAVRAHAVHALGQIGEASKPVVPAMADLFKDEDPSVRVQAIKAIGAIRPGPQVMIPLCVNLLEDPDPAIRQRILHTISSGGEQSVPGLIQALKDDKAKYWACVILRDIGPAGKDAVPALVETLKDPRPEIRREAILALASMDSAAADAAPEIAGQLTDQHTAVAATFALARIGKIPPDAQATIEANVRSEDKMLSTTSMWALALANPDNKEFRVQVTERLIGELKDEDPFVRVAAARALASLPPDPEVTIPLWEKAMAGADESMVAHSIDALAQLGSKAAPYLGDALKHENLRPVILQVLRQMGPEAAPATSALAGLVGSDDERASRAAVLALAAIGPGAKAAVPELVKALGQPDNPSAHAIVYALGEMGPDAAAANEALSALVGGSNQDLALISAWALNRIVPGPTTAAKTLPVLVAGLSSANAINRRGSAESLGAMGPLAKEAVAALEHAKSDTDPTVAAAATQALTKIQG